MEINLNMHFDTITYKEFNMRTKENTSFLLDIFVVRSVYQSTPVIGSATNSGIVGVSIVCMRVVVLTGWFKHRTKQRDADDEYETTRLVNAGVRSMLP